MLRLLPAIHYLGERLPNTVRLSASDSHYTSTRLATRAIGHDVVKQCDEQKPYTDLAFLGV